MFEPVGNISSGVEVGAIGTVFGPLEAIGTYNSLDFRNVRILHEGVVEVEDGVLVRIINATNEINRYLECGRIDNEVFPVGVVGLVLEKREDGRLVKGHVVPGGNVIIIEMIFRRFRERGKLLGEGLIEIRLEIAVLERVTPEPIVRWM